jgi:uncharacterized protein
MEQIYKKFLVEECLVASDTAHDITHTERVTANAKMIADNLDSDRQIVIAAAWLHDCVSLPKDHPDRKKTSVLSADRAVKFLAAQDFPEVKLDQVHHAIAAHSFSAGIKPETTEAKILQDADRLDALGAIGISRCLLVAGQLGRTLHHPVDPFCKERTPDDSEWTIDHFYSKLFKLPGKMQTEPGKEIANKRVEFMKKYLEELAGEIQLHI